VTSAQSTPYVSLEEFLELEPAEGSWLEWSGGLVYAMSGGSPMHSKLAAMIIGVLLSRVGADCTVFDSKVDIWVERAEFYGQANVSVVCGPLHVHRVSRNDKTLGEAITNPKVIVEVLSPSTEARDRGEKFAAYKQITALEEYVLVSQDERRIEVRRRGPRGWSADIATAGQTIRIHGHDIAVDAIYGAPG
jgi:Uma2 family endonuclease